PMGHVRQSAAHRLRLLAAEPHDLRRCLCAATADGRHADDGRRHAEWSAPRVAVSVSRRGWATDAVAERAALSVRHLRTALGFRAAAGWPDRLRVCPR